MGRHGRGGDDLRVGGLQNVHLLGSGHLPYDDNKTTPRCVYPHPSDHSRTLAAAQARGGAPAADIDRGASSNRSISRARAQAAADQLNVAAEYWLSIDRTDRRTPDHYDDT